MDEAGRSSDRDRLAPREAGGDLHPPLPLPARAHQPEPGDAGIDDQHALELAVMHDCLGRDDDGGRLVAGEERTPELARAKSRGVGEIDLEETGSAGSIGRGLDLGEAPLEIMVDTLDPDGHRVANRQALPGGLW